jgi:hypothetical protein
LKTLTQALVAYGRAANHISTLDNLLLY